MAVFPERESEITALARQVTDGLTQLAEDFPAAS
jgi:hypothetical protein